MAESVRIKCTGTDSDGAEYEAFADITVNAPAPPEELAPVITSLTIDDNTLNPGQTTNVTVIGLNYSSVNWAVTGGTLVEHSDGVEKQEFTTPTNVVAGTQYTITVTLANDHGSDIESLSATINNVAPVITSLSGIPQAPNSVTVGNSFTASVVASDVNGDSLRYTWQSTGVSQQVGTFTNERDFTAPDSITDVSDAQKTIICTAHDIPPSSYTSLSNSMQQGFIIAGGKPDIPILDTPTPTQSTIRLDWSAPTDTGGAPITGYRVWIRIGSSTNFTRSVVLSSTITNYTYENLALDTPHEVAVECFNTFTIAGNNYGQTSDMATQNVRTQPERVAPPPEDPNDHAPSLRALTPITRDYPVSQIEDLQEVIVHNMSVDYSDADGDTVAISWETSASSQLAGSLSADPQPNAFAGITTAQLTIPAGNLGSQSISCVGIDGRDPTKFGIVVFVVRAILLT